MELVGLFVIGAFATIGAITVSILIAIGLDNL